VKALRFCFIVAMLLVQMLLIWRLHVQVVDLRTGYEHCLSCYNQIDQRLTHNGIKPSNFKSQADYEAWIDWHSDRH